MLAILLATVLVAPPIDVVRPEERATYKAMLVQEALSSDTAFAGSPCPNAAVQDVFTKRVTIADHPDAPVLREKLAVTGCGRTSIQNVFVARSSGSPPWRMANAMPGDSLADAGMQANVWAAAIKQARVGLPSGCQGQRLDDIYVAARPGHVSFRAPGDAPPPARAGWLSIALPTDLGAQKAEFDVAQAWVEVWPLALCGQDRTLAVVFVPLRDHTRSAYAFMPLWRIVQARGLLALPPPAPPSDQAEGAPNIQPTSPIPAS